MLGFIADPKIFILSQIKASPLLKWTYSVIYLFRDSANIYWTVTEMNKVCLHKLLVVEWRRQALTQTILIQCGKCWQIRVRTKCSENIDGEMPDWTWGGGGKEKAPRWSGELYSIVVTKRLALEPDYLHLNPGSATYPLSNLGWVAWSLYASPCHSGKWEN